MLNQEAMAREYLRDLLYDLLIYRPGPTPATELAKSLPDGLQFAAEFVETVLAESPRFTELEHSYDLAHRSGIAHKGLGGAVADILQGFGRPMPKPLALGELLLAGKGDLEDCRQFLDSMIARGKLQRLDDQFVYLAEWLFVPMSGMDRQRVVYLNALDQDPDLAQVMDTCTDAKLGSRSLTDTAEAVLEAAQRPLSNKALGFLVGCHQGERYNPHDLLRQMVYDDRQRFVCIGGTRWVLAQWIEATHRTLRKHAPAETAPEQPPDIEQLLIKEVPADKRYQLSEDETGRITTLVHAARAPVSIEQVLADVLGLTPNQRKYAPAAQAVQQLLSSLSSLRALHGARYLRTAAIPPWTRSVPESLVPPKWTWQTDRQGMLSSEDVMLGSQGLEPEALEAAADPYYDDIGEPYVAPTDQQARQETTYHPILYHHYLAGTLKLRPSDMQLFAAEAKLTMIDVRLSDGRRLGLWLNQDTGLLYGWAPWYQTHLPPSGALLGLSRSGAAGEYDLYYADDTDTQTYIARDNMEHLLQLRQRFSHSLASLRRIVALLLGDDRGLSFNQLWAQLNVIRRTSRAQLASTLSLYHCFEHGEGNRWHFLRDKLADGYRQEKLEHVVGLKRPAAKPAKAGD